MRAFIYSLIGGNSYNKLLEDSQKAVDETPLESVTLVFKNGTKREINGEEARKWQKALYMVGFRGYFEKEFKEVKWTTTKPS